MSYYEIRPHFTATNIGSFGPFDDPVDAIVAARQRLCDACLWFDVVETTKEAGAIVVYRVRRIREDEPRFYTVVEDNDGAGIFTLKNFV